MIRGIAASPGVVFGRAFIHGEEELRIVEADIEESKVEEEVERFQEAVEKARREYGKVQKKIAMEIGREKARLFDVHLMLLEDAIGETVQRIREEKKNAEFAFFQALGNVMQALLSTGDGHLRERVADIKDVKKRVLKNLMETEKQTLKKLDSPIIIVARDLTPSDTALLDRRKVLGFATDLGGRTSHAAIVARSLGVPAVVGLKEVSRRTRQGDLLILDGINGIVYINPDEETLNLYRRERERFLQRERELLSFRDLPATTLDGRTVELAANIELPEEIDSAIYHGAQGIGLYRTEYLYLARPSLPSEEEQHEAYRYIAEKMAPYPVIIRTFDLGGDKLVSDMHTVQELNPFLGWRAIRASLDLLDIFKIQLQAILRASVVGNLKIMFPMISSLNELLQVKDVLEEVKQQLREKGVPFDEGCELGVMIEIPSAALVADQLAKEVDFFSIGTNDLIQYVIAVDRGNERIAYLFNPLHPAVLRLIKMVIEAGHNNGIWVGMCGEMSGEPLDVWLLLGLGLDEFSMSPIVLPEVKKIIRSITYKEAKAIAQEAMKFNTAEEIEAFVKRKMEEKFLVSLV